MRLPALVPPAAACALACAGLLSCGGGGSGSSAPPAGSRAQARVELGFRLFFDERLSSPPGVSCGACHDPERGWGDGFPQGRGVQDHTLAGDTDGDGVADHDSALAVASNHFKTILSRRNTPTLYNAALYPSLFWDGSALGLAHQAQFQVEDPQAMNSDWDGRVLPLLAADPDYPQDFAGAFGDAAITRERAATALAAYESTLAVFDTPFDAFLAGSTQALGPDERRGLDLFFGPAGCYRCHPAPLLTDLAFHNTGVPSAGTAALEGEPDLGYGERLDLSAAPAGAPVQVDDPSAYAAFKTPQLRMVAVTGPYMHNGAFATLEEVVEFYDQGGGPDLSGTGTKSPLLVPLGLGPQDRSDLVAFLRVALTGEEIR